MNNIKALIIAAVLAPVTLYAAPQTENHELAKKCHQLSKELDLLKKLESIGFCKEKIQSASTYAEMAGEELIMDGIHTAKMEIKLAITALAYSAVEECDQATNIGVAKNELQQIHDALL
jgi:hypothetical protein